MKKVSLSDELFELFICQQQSMEVLLFWESFWVLYHQLCHDVSSLQHFKRACVGTSKRVLMPRCVKFCSTRFELLQYSSDIQQSNKSALRIIRILCNDMKILTQMKFYFAAVTNETCGMETDQKLIRLSIRWITIIARFHWNKNWFQVNHNEMFPSSMIETSTVGNIQSIFIFQLVRMLFKVILRPLSGNVGERYEKKKLIANQKDHLRFISHNYRLEH